jgi:hypothetical protein
VTEMIRRLAGERRIDYARAIELSFAL